MFFFYRCFGFFLGYFRKVDEIDMKMENNFGDARWRTIGMKKIP